MAVKIMMLSQWFDPEPMFKGVYFAKELIKQGFDVEVVTGFPNYPGGSLYSGYKLRLIQREIIDGVHVTRLPLYPSHNRSVWGRIANYGSFALSSLIYGLLIAKRPDVIYAYHPPLTTGMSALLVRFFRRVPVVYDIQDMWPDSLAATGMLTNKRLLNILGSLCKFIYQRMDRITVLSPGFKQILIERGVPADKIHIIYNWCNEHALSSSSHLKKIDEPTQPVKLRILFAGNIGRAQGLDTVLDAAKKLMAIGSTAFFELLGSGVDSEKIASRIREEDIDNVVSLPHVPMNEVGRFLKSADILLVHLKKDPLFSITIPSKTQSYMAAGKPILMAVPGDAADLIKMANCGVIALSDDVDSIVQAVLKLECMSQFERNAMGERGAAFYFDRLSLKEGVAQFSEQFHFIINEYNK